jgi:hypothetical protein
MALILIGFFVKDLIGHRIGKFIFLKDRDRSGKWKKVDPVQSCLGIILSLNKRLLFVKITVDIIFRKWYFLSRGAPPYFATEVSPICFRKLKFGKINKFLAPNDIYVKMSGRVRPAVPKSQNRGEPVCKWIILWHTAIFLLNWIISRLIFFKFYEIYVTWRAIRRARYKITRYVSIKEKIWLHFIFASFYFVYMIKTKVNKISKADTALAFLFKQLISNAYTI